MHINLQYFKQIFYSVQLDVGTWKLVTFNLHLYEIFISLFVRINISQLYLHIVSFDIHTSTTTHY